MNEIELIEKTAVNVGMTSLLNHGAASCVYSEGCNGVTQEHLVAFTREVALHCLAAMGPQPAAPVQPPAKVEREALTGWQPIETAPKTNRDMFVVRAFDVTNENCGVRRYTSDPYCVWPGDEGGWVRWPHPFPPTHWMPLPPAPTVAEKENGNG